VYARSAIPLMQRLKCRSAVCSESWVGYCCPCPIGLSLPLILAHFLGGLDGALGFIASPHRLGGWVAAVVAVVAGEGGDDLVVEGLGQ
jgi:hypothetical protein